MLWGSFNLKNINMGLFGFLGNMVSATVKTVVVAPIAVVADVVNLEPFERTGEVMDSAL